MNFDEKSGEVPCITSWGKWHQTMDSVFIHVDVQAGTRGSNVRCDITARSLKLAVKGEEIISGELFARVVVDDCVWTVEDGCLVRIALCKSSRYPSDCWKSLLQHQYDADAATVDSMEKKLTLERFQRENPGFDFSKADITGNYHGGGPKLPLS